MSKDVLFLLAPGFSDNGRREYCPECAEIWGLLSYFPAIKESIEIRYQGINTPRADLVILLDESHQNCPTLVLSDVSPEYSGCGVGDVNGVRFIDNACDIGKYYAQRFGTPWPRGC